MALMPASTVPDRANGVRLPATMAVFSGGLFIYCHGGLWATAFSADRAVRRRDLPGTMHLVRATAIEDALAAGCHAIELGGVDLPGHRLPPRPGDANRGLYEHKRGFGARWVEREPARRIVLRPGADRLARARRRGVDALRGMRRWARPPGTAPGDAARGGLR